jgi:choline dehydrogenase-like flavoprotein
VTRWVVVGAGSGGAVAAARLSEHADNEVTLLEAGADLDTADAAHHGADFFGALRSPGRTHDLLVVPVDGHQPRPYLRGRGVGGSGAINAMLAPPGGPFAIEHLLPTELAAEHELGAVDRALLAAAPDAARVPLTRRNGRRVTVAEQYVEPARARPNFRVAANAAVDRVVLDGRRAAGVRLLDGTTLEADRVVVSAGAIHSPAILLRSGVDTPGVGEGLEDHPSAAITLELRPGAVAAPGSLAAGTLLVRDGFQVLPLNHLGGALPYGVLMPALMRVRSAGRVTLVDDDPATQPRVEFRMLSHPDDVAGLVEAVRVTLDLVRHPAFEAIVVQAFADDDGTTIDALDSPERIAAWLPDHVGDYAHASSSCRMGTVVDRTGAVVGYEHLYVCDASVFERVPEVNPHLPTVRLAETLSARWLGRGVTG